jgi:hypothetical protein
MARSRTALERHFEPDTALMLDALIEGLTMHRALSLKPCRSVLSVKLSKGSSPHDP